MILLAVKLLRLDVLSNKLKRGFNFPFKFIYGQPVTEAIFEKCTKSRDTKLKAEK